MEYSFKELPFLDILIKNQNDQIINDIYHKPTNTWQYFHFKSHYCLKSIPYILVCWIFTIVINKNLWQTHLELHVTLHQRG